MKTTVFFAPLMAAAFALSGCQTSNDDNYQQAVAPLARIPVVNVTGQATYRERIALAPGMIYTVQLLDVSRADAPSTVITEYKQTLNGEQVPLPFTLQTTQNHIKTNMTYAVRATLTTPEGKLAWTTDTLHTINPSELNQNLGTLVMVKVGTPPAASATAQLVDGWNVQSIGGAPVAANSAPAITFAGDGAVMGTTGCNRFAGTYQANGANLKLGPLAVTQMACVPALNTQETQMLSILNSLSDWQIISDGRLVLRSTDGRTIVAAPQ